MQLIQPGLVLPRVAMMRAVPIAIPQMAARRVMVMMQEPEWEALIPYWHDGDAQPLHDRRGGLIAVVALDRSLQLPPKGGEVARHRIQADR